MTVVTNIMVNRILFEGHRTVGVERVVNGQRNEFCAEAEIILCLGATRVTSGNTMAPASWSVNSP